MNSKVSKSVLLFIFVFLLLVVQVFSTGSRRWISLSSGEASSSGGDPHCEKITSNSEQYSFIMKTAGFYVNDRLEGRMMFHSLELAKYHGDLGAGYPNLPVIRRYIYVPGGKTPKVQVSMGEAVVFSNYRVYPVQKPQQDLKGAVDPPFYIDEMAYASDQFFPRKSVFLEKVQSIRGHQVVMVHVCPFSYNPAGKILKVFPNIKVNITFEGSSDGVDARLQSSVFNSFVHGIVDNSNLINAAGGNSDDDGVDFLIITSPDFTVAADALKAHKDLLGIPTVVKTTAETGTSKNDIQAYIQTAYDTWNPAPSFVLLLGDVETIPTTYDTSADMGTDLYYSTLDGEDILPDIFLGRISVDTLEEAQTVVQKIIGYESTPPVQDSFYANGMVSAYFQDYDDGYADRRFVQTSEEVRDYLLTQGYCVSRVYCRSQSSPNPTNFNNGIYGNGEPIPSELMVENGFAWDGDAADISTGINSGLFFLLHRDHGMDRNDGFTDTGWADPYFVQTHIAALTNGVHLPVVFSINCQTGWFDGETDANSGTSFESFCELFLRQQNGGAVGVIGATRNSYSGHNDFLAEGFFDCVWPDFLPSVPNTASNSQLGPILNHGKLAMDIIWGDPWDLRQTEYELFHVHGDPTMKMWTGKTGSPGFQTVRVESEPYLNIPITVDQNDVNGNGDGDSNFIRTYVFGTTVTLTAPPVFNGKDFIRWIVNGVPVDDQSVVLIMNQFYRVQAVYMAEYSIEIKSYPVPGLSVTVSPADLNGDSDGETPMTRYYTTDTTVTLTAPDTFGGRLFSHWDVDGDEIVTPILEVTMDQIKSVTAHYLLLPTDVFSLIIDLDSSNSSAPVIESALQSLGEATHMETSVPQSINPALYPRVFVCLGTFANNHVLNAAEGDVLTEYLNNGGSLYMEGGDTWAYDSETSVHPYFGITGLSDGSGDTANISGVTGGFTEGISFLYEGDNSYMDHIGVTDGISDAFLIWENISPSYQNGIARNTGAYRTIGTSFEFSGIPAANRTEVMEKYLEFFNITFIQVTSPDGGEDWGMGSVQNITWTGRDIDASLVRIQLYQNGTRIGNIASNVDASLGTYPWTVGTYIGGTAPAGVGYTIRLRLQGTTVNDFSDGPFTITDSTPEITVLSPNGGESWGAGTTREITWSSQGMTGSLVRIMLYRNGAKVGNIASNLDASAGTHSWTVGSFVGGTAPTGSGYTIRIREQGTAVNDYSDASFSITSATPEITVLSPNGGENWVAGTSHNITWSSQNLAPGALLRLQLYRNGAKVGNIAGNVDATLGTYSWAAGNYIGGTAPAGGGYTIRIRVQGTTIDDVSNASFAIGTP